MEHITWEDAKAALKACKRVTHQSWIDMGHITANMTLIDGILSLNDCPKLVGEFNPSLALAFSDQWLIWHGFAEVLEEEKHIADVTEFLDQNEKFLIEQENERKAKQAVNIGIDYAGKSQDRTAIMTIGEHGVYYDGDASALSMTYANCIDAEKLKHDLESHEVKHEAAQSLGLTDDQAKAILDWPNKTSKDDVEKALYTAERPDNNYSVSAMSKIEFDPERKKVWEQEKAIYNKRKAKLKQEIELPFSPDDVIAKAQKEAATNG